MHQETPDLLLREVQPILPNVPVFDIAIFLDLEIVGNGREVPGIAPEDALNRILGSRVRRHLGRIVDGVIQNTGLRGLSLGIDAQKGVPEHRGRIVHETGGEDDADRLGVELIEPSGEALTWLRRQAAVVEMQLLLEPVITGHEGALCRLLGTAYYFVREKLAERRRQLGLG